MNISAGSKEPIPRQAQNEDRLQPPFLISNLAEEHRSATTAIRTRGADAYKGLVFSKQIATLAKIPQLAATFVLGFFVRAPVSARGEGLLQRRRRQRARSTTKHSTFYSGCAFRKEGSAGNPNHQWHPAARAKFRPLC
jgi:hypothetical protein